MEPLAVIVFIGLAILVLWRRNNAPRPKVRLRPEEPISTGWVVFWTIIFVPFGLIALVNQNRQRKLVKEWEEQQRHIM